MFLRLIYLHADERLHGAVQLHPPYASPSVATPPLTMRRTDGEGAESPKLPYHAQRAVLALRVLVTLVNMGSGLKVPAVVEGVPPGRAHHQCDGKLIATLASSAFAVLTSRPVAREPMRQPCSWYWVLHAGQCANMTGLAELDLKDSIPCLSCRAFDRSLVAWT
jgi:hypothetical protein